MKETEQTLLDQIKDQVAKEWRWSSWNDFAFYELKDQFNCGKIINEICERYATAKAKASCEATLKNASENANVSGTHPIPQDIKDQVEFEHNSINEAWELWGNIAKKDNVNPHAFVFGYVEAKKKYVVSAPSESQEELLSEILENWQDFITDTDNNDTDFSLAKQQFMKAELEKFKITRNP